VNIDERLERLTQRHEALAQSVEGNTIDIKLHLETLKKDGEHINALAKIAEHQRDADAANWAAYREEQRERDVERKRRDDALGDRISALVSGIGEFIASQKRGEA